MFAVDTPETYRQTEEGADDNRSTQLLQALLGRLEQVPQVRAAAAVNMRPLVGGSTGLGIVAADDPGEPGEAVPWASWRFITPDYFRAMGVPLLRGRIFTDEDRIGGDPWRVVVSKRVADLLWAERDPIGRQIILWRGQQEEVGEVIGVVGDMRERGLANDPTLAVYFPYYGTAWSPVHFVVDADGTPGDLVPTFRALLSEIDPDLPISSVQSMEAIVADSVAPRRFSMLLLGAFAAVALALTLAGVYGVLSYGVARRGNEIGVRLALGASQGSVLGLVVRQGMRPVLAGMAAGLAGALAISRLLSGLLFEVSPADPSTYVAVAAVLALAAVAACTLPARRALRADPLQALREE
jgi:putative ABC transport system permease protein